MSYLESENRHRKRLHQEAKLQTMKQQFATANAELNRIDIGIDVVPIEYQEVALNTTVGNLKFSRENCSQRTLFWIEKAFQAGFQNYGTRSDSVLEQRIEYGMKGRIHSTGLLHILCRGCSE